jgi:hypothetical protein
MSTTTRLASPARSTTTMCAAVIWIIVPAALLSGTSDKSSSRYPGKYGVGSAGVEASAAYTVGEASRS